MFCKSCGKSIPDDSKFCLHCGDKIKVDQAREILHEAIPVAIQSTYFWTDGPRNIDTGSVFTYIERGFGFAFSLIDSDGRLTICDGKLVLCFHLGVHVLYSSNQKGFNKSKKEATIVREFVVKKEEFSWNGYKNRNKQWEDLTYQHQDFKNLISLTDVSGWRPHFWFIKFDGNLLYKKGDNFTLE